VFSASLRLKDKNLNSGNITINKHLAQAYFSGLISGLVLVNEDNTLIIETYNAKELAEMMSHMSPRYAKETSKISYYLAKRK
jgi:hypothetical protein